MVKEDRLGKFGVEPFSERVPQLRRADGVQPGGHEWCLHRHRRPLHLQDNGQYGLLDAIRTWRGRHGVLTPRRRLANHQIYSFHAICGARKPRRFKIFGSQRISNRLERRMIKE